MAKPKSKATTPAHELSTYAPMLINPACKVKGQGDKIYRWEYYKESDGEVALYDDENDLMEYIDVRHVIPLLFEYESLTDEQLIWLINTFNAAYVMADPAELRKHIVRHPNLRMWSAEVMLKLCKWNIDVFDLATKGLAEIVTTPQ